MQDEYIDRLIQYAVTPTPQRLEIASILFSQPRHLSADQLLDELRGNGSAVSKATVYNTLNLFADKGLIGTRLVDPDRVTYDSETEPHHHFLDIDTGELQDVSPDSVKIESLPELPPGFELQGVEVTIRIRRK